METQQQADDLNLVYRGAVSVLAFGGKYPSRGLLTLGVKKKKTPQYELFHLRWLSQKQGEFSLYVYHYLPHIHYKTMLRKLRSSKANLNFKSHGGNLG